MIVQIDTNKKTSDVKLERTLTFRDVIIDKRYDKIYSHTFGSRTSNETLADLLSKVSSKGEPLRIGIAAILMNQEAYAHIFQALFPNQKSSYLKVDSNSILHEALRDLISSKVEKYVESELAQEATMVMMELISRVFRKTKVIRPTRGVVALSQSDTMYPIGRDFIQLADKAAIENALDTHPVEVAFDLKSNITFNYLVSMVSTVFNDLGYALTHTDTYTRYMSDTMYYVMRRHENVFDNVILPEAVRTSPALEKLMSNLTFYTAALQHFYSTAHTHVPMTGEWQLEEAFRTVVTLIAKSPRYEIQPISSVADSFRTSPLVGERNELKGVIITKNKIGEARTQITSFIPVGKATNLSMQMPHPTAESFFDTLVNPLFAKLTPDLIHDKLHMLYSSVVTSLKKPIGVTVGLNPIELVHLAMSRVNNIVYGRNETGLPVPYYKVDLHGLNYPASTRSMGNVLLTEDPIEALMLLPGHVGSVPATPGVQTIPDGDRDKFLWADLDKIGTKLSKQLTYKFKIAGKERKVNISIQEMLSFSMALETYVTKPVVNKRIIHDYISSVKDFRDYAAKLQIGKDPNISDLQLRLQVAMICNDIISPLYTSVIGKSIVESVFHKTLLSEDIKQADFALVVSDLHNRKQRMKMEFWTCFAIMVKLNLIDYDLVQFIEAVLDDEGVIDYLSLE